MRIVKAEQADLPGILALQHLAYQSEAELLGSHDIPPLRQTLPELQQEYENGTVLKCTDEQGCIIGSVRGYTSDGTLYVGKLMVHPECQGQGIGTLLLKEIEDLCPQPRCELFTSSKSTRNIALYERAGYTRFKEQPLFDGIRLVYLEKKR